MAKVEHRDQREYHISIGRFRPFILVNTYIPIPVAGTIVRVMAACAVEPDANNAISFALGSQQLQSGGLNAAMNLLNVDLVGTVHTVELDPDDPLNFAFAAENLDLSGAG